MGDVTGNIRAYRIYFSIAAGFSLVIAAAFFTWHAVYRLQTNEIRRTLSARVNLYEGTIRQTVDRYSYLPQILSLDPRITDLLRHPYDAARVRELNQLLETIGKHSGTAVIYVVDASGMTLAASNWNEILSFVGNNYAFRPYFTEAIQNGAGRFYGVGVTTNEPGYFISARVGPAEAPLGVATVKISLNALQNEWRAADEAVLLADEKGVVFLSSRQPWVYRPLLPLSQEALKQASATHQYGDANLAGRPLAAPGSDLATGVVALNERSGPSENYAVMHKQLAGLGWTIAVLHGFREVRHIAAQAAALAGLTLSVILLLAVVLAQRRSTIREKLRAHDELERRVKERTRELVLTNQRLGQEITQRINAEAHLRQTQDDLIQTGKLAALGHMSAALSHEISQPLAALRTYVSSTARLAGHGDLEGVKSNMGRIGHLIGRMVDITCHLKRFARVEAGPPSQARLDAVLGNALALVAMRIDAEGVELRQEGDFHVTVKGSDNRLEQVFVNLLTNALDAMQDCQERRITIRAIPGHESVALDIEDSGSGISPENYGLIFAPYFTTKEVGSGLGLGLSISHTIIQSFGGSLAVRAAPAGGAIFTTHLKIAEAAQASREAAE